MPDPVLPLAAFHFLRPAWLLIVPAAILLGWLYSRRRDPAQRYADMIAPHLLAHLVVGGAGKRRFGPALVFLGLGLGGIAVAGPTWRQEASPFADDKAAVILTLDASASMKTKDLAPSRFERAKQKARDLLALREGGRTGIVVYSGSAHVVLPLTDDLGILELYLGALDPGILPREGKRTDLALAEAQALLDRDKTPGTIVLLTDEVPLEAIRGHKGAPVRVLRVAPGATGASSGAEVTRLTADDADVRTVDDGIERHLASAQAEDGTTRWQDMGWYLLLPLVLASLFWFRRGWSVRWAPVLVLAATVFAAEPAHAHESALRDAFQTPDQQGRAHFEAGDFAAAAQHFEDPSWKATAYYRLGEYELAEAWYAKLDTAAAWYGRGNALVTLARLSDAVVAYGEALTREPEAEDVQANLAIVRAVIKRRAEEEPAEGGSTLRPDKFVMDDPDKKDQRKRPEQEETTLGGSMDERMAEVWMRQVQTTPAAFLRTKFATQLRARKEDER
ncbi:MAG: VWA domain-containing protein [Planctomycetota bacterium]|nr:VWA domain-containing protein [Planctomycetota bacterium]